MRDRQLLLDQGDLRALLSECCVDLIGVEPHSDHGREELGKPCLALLKRERPLILAVQLEQVERIQDDVMVTATRVQFLE